MSPINKIKFCIIAVLSAVVFTTLAANAAPISSTPIQGQPVQLNNFPTPVKLTEVGVLVKNHDITYLDPYVLMGQVNLGDRTTLKNGTMSFKINGKLVKEPIPAMWGGGIDSVVSSVPVNQEGIGVWDNKNYHYRELFQAGANSIEAEFNGITQNNVHLSGKGVGTLTIHKIPTKIYITKFIPHNHQGKLKWMIQGFVGSDTQGQPKYVASAQGIVSIYFNGKNAGTVPAFAKEGYNSLNVFRVYYDWGSTPQSTVNLAFQYNGEELTKTGYAVGQIKYLGPSTAPELYIDGKRIYPSPATKYDNP